MEQTLERAENFLPRVDEPAFRQNTVHGRVVSLTAPASTAAEQYRTLHYRLDRLRSAREMKVVAFTSALPGEGKTVTAVNLALASARANPDRSVLLIDADLRRGQVSELLGIRARPGLSELLAGECEALDALRRFRSTHLTVIPAGAIVEEPTTLLASATMRKFLKAMRNSFDEVYVDLPPALPFADASILTASADGVVLVIRAHTTASARVQEALDSLGGAPIVGCVLNGAEPFATPYLKERAR